MSAATAKKSGAKHGEEKKPRRRIKKVAGHGGHHGGAWKVAYADFVTAMMALFLVLWLLSQADTKLKESIANYFRAPGAFNTLRGGILDGPRKPSKEPSSLTSKDEEKAFLSAAISIKRQFSARPEFNGVKDQVKVDVTAEGLRIQIIDKADKVSFDSGSSELKDSAKLILTEVAKGICQMPNPINIGGHTDSKPFGDGAGYTNWELSADRANAARRALETSCVKPSQIRRVIGYADTELLTPDDPYAAANRRISITVLRLANSNEGKGLTPMLVEQGSTEEQQNEHKSKEKGAKPESGNGDAKSPERKSSVEKPDQNAPHQPESEASRARTRLRTQGSVTVGMPDELPAGAKRVKH